MHGDPRPGTVFPAFEMEAYKILRIVDFPRTEAGKLAGTVHPQLQVCVCVVGRRGKTFLGHTLGCVRKLRSRGRDHSVSHRVTRIRSRRAVAWGSTSGPYCLFRNPECKQA